MDRPSKQTRANGAAIVAGRTAQSGPGGGTPMFTGFELIRDPGQTAGEAFHPVTDRALIRETAADPRAAAGIPLPLGGVDDDIMRRQAPAADGTQIARTTR